MVRKNLVGNRLRTAGGVLGGLLRRRDVRTPEALEAQGDDNTALIRLRLVERSERDALRNSGLHDVLLSRAVRRDVERELRAVALVARGDEGEVFLMEVARMVAERLRAIGPVVDAVRETVGYGETKFEGEEEWYAILARWLIENQCGGAVVWDATSDVRSRRQLHN